ncbi:MAG TPA: hypothetical protein VGI99_09310, partial [Gemmataceae bacterium]
NLGREGREMVGSRAGYDTRAAMCKITDGHAFSTFSPDAINAAETGRRKPPPSGKAKQKR